MSTTRPTTVFRCFILLAAMLGAGAASADVAPPNSCNTAGQACNTALDSAGRYDADGTCVATTCSHATPQLDGSIGTTSYPCTLCMATDGGTSRGTASDGGTSAGGGSSSGGGCAVGAVGAQALAPLGLVLAGAAILAASRRRTGRR